MKFEGIMPALVTPLKEDETINVPVLRSLIEYLLERDADGFYVGGATGEGLALKTEERMVLAEEAIRAVHGRKPCIVQVAAADFKDAIALAKHAEACGANAISATPPLFFRYDEDDVYNYYKALAEAVQPKVSYEIDVAALVAGYDATTDGSGMNSIAVANGVLARAVGMRCQKYGIGINALRRQGV
jgi:N-acetylneuraminate lyase